jgi:hypothetical protein
MAGRWYYPVYHPYVLFSFGQDSNDPNLFATEVRNLAGSTLSLGVWSAKACSRKELR